MLNMILGKLKNGAKGVFEDFNTFADDVFKWIEELFKGVKPVEAVELTIGKYSKRAFDLKNAGGPILNLKWNNAKITREGIEIIKKHLNRFEEVDANKKMIARLEKIESGEISITDWDKRFYTHEIREYERFKNLGHELTNYKDFPKALYNNAHSATLEDYKIYELDSDRNSILYHPVVDQIQDFLNDIEKQLINKKL